MCEMPKPQNEAFVCERIIIIISRRPSDLKLNISYADVKKPRNQRPIQVKPTQFIES